MLPRNRTLSADSTVITFTPAAERRLVRGGQRRHPDARRVLRHHPRLSAPARHHRQDHDPPGRHLPVVGQQRGADGESGGHADLERRRPSPSADTAQVVVGAQAATVTNCTANSITFVPAPLSTGHLSVNGVTVAGFNLSLPTNADTIATGDFVAAAGTDDPTTAPYDAPRAAHCRGRAGCSTTCPTSRARPRLRFLQARHPGCRWGLRYHHQLGHRVGRRHVRV